jgi:hypothetical protein
MFPSVCIAPPQPGSCRHGLPDDASGFGLFTCLWAPKSDPTNDWLVASRPWSNFLLSLHTGPCGLACQREHGSRETEDSSVSGDAGNGGEMHVGGLALALVRATKPHSAAPRESGWAIYTLPIAPDLHAKGLASRGLAAETKPGSVTMPTNHALHCCSSSTSSSFQ